MKSLFLNNLNIKGLNKVKFWDIEEENWCEEEHNIMMTNDVELYNQSTDENVTSKYLIINSINLKDKNKKELFELDVLLIEEEIYYIEFFNHKPQLKCINQLDFNFIEEYSNYNDENINDIIYYREIKKIGNILELDKIKELKKDFLKLIDFN